MEIKMKDEILAGKWNLPAWPEELAGLMGECTPEQAMITKIEAQEHDLSQCANDKEKAAKILEILAA